MIKILLSGILMILLVVSACHTPMPQSGIEDNSNLEISADTINSTSRLADSLDLFNVDDYPITEKQLIGKYAVVNSGKSKSYDKAWFKNDSITQSLVIELYTDYHRFVIYCFDNKNIPIELIERFNSRLYKVLVIFC